MAYYGKCDWCYGNESTDEILFRVGTLIVEEICECEDFCGAPWCRNSDEDKEVTTT